MLQSIIIDGMTCNTAYILKREEDADAGQYRWGDPAACRYLCRHNTEGSQRERLQDSDKNIVP